MNMSNKAFVLLGGMLFILILITQSLGPVMGMSIEAPDNQVYIPLVVENSPQTITAISSVDDGEVLNVYCTNWETCRNAPSSNQFWEGLEVGTVGASFASGYDFIVQRTFYFFDTSSIPAGAQIIQATLNVYVSEWKNGNDTVHVVRSTADIPLDTDDFSKFENVSGGSANPFSTYSWMRIDLDEAALDWIVKGDTTKLALIHDFDLNNIEPVGRNDVLMAMSEDSESRPYLEITYALSDVGG